jgi:hypothetical protein
VLRLARFFATLADGETRGSVVDLLEYDVMSGVS